jgi:hypothetical protein
LRSPVFFILNSATLFPGNMKVLCLVLLGIISSVVAQTAPAVAPAAAANASAPVVAPITKFFGQVARGEVLGMRKCKKLRDCGLGLRCDLLLNLCVPFNTPILSDIEKPCMNQSECSPLHACQAGFCRFCGPKSCRSSFDCCASSLAQAGQPGRVYQCVNLEDLEKQSMARQLGRPVLQQMPGGHSPEDAIESEELVGLGISNQGDVAFYGDRCWAVCNADADCYNQHTPEPIKKSTGCCNGVCSRRQSCVNVPQSAIHLQQQQQQLAAQHQQQLFLQQQAQAAGGSRQAQAAGAWGSHGHSQMLGAPAPRQPGL